MRRFLLVDDGDSKKMSRITVSMIDLRPPAPVPMLMACRAISPRASSSNSRLKPSRASMFVYCCTMESAGSVRMRVIVDSSSGST